MSDHVKHLVVCQQGPLHDREFEVVAPPNELPPSICFSDGELSHLYKYDSWGIRETWPDTPPTYKKTNRMIHWYVYEPDRSST